MVGHLKKSLGLRVRAARKRCEFTQEELAAQINRTPESVSNIERGLQLPSIETIADLGRVLGVPIAEFFEDSVDIDLARSPKRIELEARLREIARALDDRDLRIVVAQAFAFLVERSKVEF